MSPEQPLDLTRERSISEVMAATLETFRAHFSLFFPLTLLIVAPVTLLVEGVWQRELANGSQVHELSGAHATVSLLLYLVVVPPLVTTLNTVIVTQLGRGIRPGFAAVLREAGTRLPAAITTVLLYSAGVILGFAFILPGIWLMIRWCLAVQSTVVNRTGPVASLRVSSELVQGRWWRTCGAIILAALAFGLPGQLLDALAREVNNGVAYVSIDIVIDAIVVSLSSIFATLLYFSWRASPPSSGSRS